MTFLSIAAGEGVSPSRRRDSAVGASARGRRERAGGPAPPCPDHVIGSAPTAGFSRANATSRSAYDSNRGTETPVPASASRVFGQR